MIYAVMRGHVSGWLVAAMVLALVVDATRCRTRRARAAGEPYDELQEQRRLPAEDPPSAQLPCAHGGVTVTR